MHASTFKLLVLKCRPASKLLAPKCRHNHYQVHKFARAALWTPMFQRQGLQNFYREQFEERHQATAQSAKLACSAQRLQKAQLWYALLRQAQRKLRLTAQVRRTHYVWLLLRQQALRLPTCSACRHCLARRRCGA